MSICLLNGKKSHSNTLFVSLLLHAAAAAVKGSAHNI